MWKCCNLITKNEWRTDDRINIRAASWCRSASWEISTPPLRRRWDLALDLWERCNELQQTFHLQQFQHEIRSWGRSLTQVVVGGCQQLSQPLKLIKIRICIFLLAQPPAVDPLGAGWRRRKAEWREGEGGGGGGVGEGGGDLWNHGLEKSGECFPGSGSSLNLCTGTGNLVCFREN